MAHHDDDADAKVAKCRRLAKFRQYLAAFLANISAFSIGTMLGWTSPSQPLLSSANPPVGTEPMSDEFISWLGSVNFLGAVSGTLFWGTSSDRLGRRFTAILVAIPFIVSWTLKLIAQDGWWVLVARVVVGVGCSGVIINTPIYVAEMAEDKIRGSLGSFLMIALNSGCVFSYVVGSLTTYHGLAAACLCVPIFFLLTFPFMPESPVYLWTHGEKDKAENSLLWFRGGDIVQTVKELEALRDRPGKPSETPSYTDLFSTRGVRKALVISLGVVFGQNFCGILAMLTYTVKIFKDSGSSLSANNSTIFVGVLQLISALMSSFLVDRAGRKILLGCSYLAMCLSLMVFAGYSYYHEDSWSPVFRWIPIACLSVNAVSYSMGVGPVPFIVMSEIFPPDIRGFATSKIQLIGTTLSFVTVKTFPFLTRALGSHGCFLVYAVCCAAMTIFTFAVIPETKGRPLQSILKQLNGEDVGSTADGEYKELFRIQRATIVKNPQT